MKFLCILSLLLVEILPFVSSLQNPMRFDGHKLLRVMPSNELHYQVLETLFEKNEIDLWNDLRIGHPVDLRVSPELYSKIQLRLKSMSPPLDFTILISDIQEMIDHQSSTSNDQKIFSSDSPTETFFNAFHTLEEIEFYFEFLEKEFPSQVSKFSIGKTFEKREINGVHLYANTSHAKPKREILFHGGIHAREWIGPAVVSYIATQFIQGYGKDEKISKLLDTFDISIIPVLNPDGYVYTHEKNRMWRKNRQPNNFFCTGIDANRNWDYKFGKGGASTNPCSEAYQGPFAFAALEAKHMSKYIKQSNGNILAYIDFHAYSQLWMYPFGAECGHYPDNKAQLDLVANAAAKALKKVHGTVYAVGPICEIIYQASGASVDWAYAIGNVSYPMAVELRDRGQYGFLLPAKQIIPSGEETLAAVIAFLEKIIELEK